MTADPDNSPPQVRLDLNWPGAGQTLVERLDPDGRWRPVRTGEPATLTGGTWLGYDVEAPIGADLRYRATWNNETVDGRALVPPPAPSGFDPAAFDPAAFQSYSTDTAATGPIYTATVRLDAEGIWLVHPGIPGLSQRLEVAGIGAVSRPKRRGVFEPMGRRLPVVVSQRRSAARYDLTVRIGTPAQRTGLDELLETGSPLYLNVPTTEDLGLSTGWVDVGDVEERRLWNYLPDPLRHVTLPMIVVDRPAGGQQAQWSWQDVLDTYPTWQAVLDSYASWGDLLANRPGRQ